MFAEQTTAAERFAAAVEHDPPGSTDPELAREVEIVALLRACGRAVTPDPAVKRAARQRLLASRPDLPTQLRRTAVEQKPGDADRAPARTLAHLGAAGSMLVAVLAVTPPPLLNALRPAPEPPTSHHRTADPTPPAPLDGR